MNYEVYGYIKKCSTFIKFVGLKYDKDIIIHKLNYYINTIIIQVLIDRLVYVKSVIYYRYYSKTISKIYYRQNYICLFNNLK